MRMFPYANMIAPKSLAIRVRSTMLTVPSEFRSARVLVVPKFLAIPTRSMMLTTPSRFRSGLLETMQLVEGELVFVSQLTASIVGKTGTARTDMVSLTPANGSVKLKVLLKMVCPEVSLTTVTVIEPEMVLAVESTVTVPNTVTVRLSKLKVLLKLVV